MAADFESHYQTVFGDEWTSLKSALLRARQHVARLTRMGVRHGVLPEGIPETLELPGCFDVREFEVLEAMEQHPDAFYLMDLASVLAVKTLLKHPAKSSWDVCAAPGGKALMLLESLAGGDALMLTDLSRPRLEKLKQVIRRYHGQDAFELPQLKLAAADGIDWGYRHQQRYDRVLLDAPCSSERHVLGDAKALAQWSPHRVKSLAKRQYGLLCSAVLATRPGGVVLYSTCSIHPSENDGVIERYLQKKTDAELLPVTAPIGRATRYGWMIRPDLDDGWGPMYFTLLRRCNDDSTPVDPSTMIVP